MLIRVLPLVVLAIASAEWASAQTASVSRELFAPAYRSARALTSGTAVGVNYEAFSGLLRDLATDIAIVADQRPNGADKAMLDKLIEVRDAYAFSRRLWEARNDSDINAMLLSFDDIESGLTEGAKRYGLEIMSGRRYNKPYTYAAPSSLERMWTIAAGLTADAVALFYGRPSNEAQ